MRSLLVYFALATLAGHQGASKIYGGTQGGTGVAGEPYSGAGGTTIINGGAPGLIGSAAGVGAVGGIVIDGTLGTQGQLPAQGDPDGYYPIEIGTRVTPQVYVGYLKDETRPASTLVLRADLGPLHFLGTGDQDIGTFDNPAGIAWTYGDAHPEVAPPNVPPQRSAEIFVRSNGKPSPYHKTQICALFSDGSINVLSEMNNPD